MKEINEQRIICSDCHNFVYEYVEMKDPDTGISKKICINCHKKEVNK